MLVTLIHSRTLTIVCCATMANSLLSINDLPQIPDIPHHPMGLTFSKRSFGEKNPVLRSFQAAWFKTWPFLHYDEGKDLSYYHICVKGFKERKDEVQKDFELACTFYEVIKDDLHPELLRYRLSIFCTEFLNLYSTVQIPPTILDIIKYTCTLTAPQKQLLVMKRIASYMTATNATSERTFSALRRIKSYRRSTMSQVRLNHLMVLQVHKALTDTIKPENIADEFVSSSQHSTKVFGNP